MALEREEVPGGGLSAAAGARRRSASVEAALRQPIRGGLGPGSITGARGRPWAGRLGRGEGGGAGHRGGRGRQYHGYDGELARELQRAGVLELRL